MDTPEHFCAAKNSTVWVVDDNKPYCVILSEVINRSARLRCDRYFTSAQNAIRELEATGHCPDVILLDIKMPVISGLDAIKPILRASPDVIIIMLTSMDEDDCVRLALRRGAKGYLLKTSTQEDILRSIEQSVAGGMPIDPMMMKTIIESYAGAAEPPDMYHLSVREIEIIRQITTGLNSSEVAGNLNISYYTVESHLKNIYHKLEVSNRHAMVAKAIKEGLA
jgi:DNA-binding NarL/FixJ family response regulator